MTSLHSSFERIPSADAKVSTRGRIGRERNWEHALTARDFFRK
jgi:squalene monooxygenase